MGTVSANRTFSDNNLASARVGRCVAFLGALIAMAIFAGHRANAQAQPQIFPIATQTALNPPGDTFPQFIGDLNGDGLPDLAYLLTPEEGTGISLVIQLSIGSSVLPPAITTNLCALQGAIPQLSFADLNNDHKLDLVFTCNGYLTIQFGNGDGTFQSPVFSANAGTPVLVDLNGDGYLDIAYFFNASVAVLLNQGTLNPGVFTSPKLYPAPSFSSGLTAGDFNGDGKQDLIYLNVPNDLPFSPYTTISFLAGNGDGTLNPAKTQSPGNFSSFTVGDFNKDGITDLALVLSPVADALNTSVQILLGSTSGTFSSGSSLPLTATSGSGAPLAAVALTSDGNLDLVTVTSVLNVFHGDGKGGFTAKGSYAFTGSSLLFADLNGDGRQDILIDGTAILDGNGDGTFQSLPATAVYGPVVDVNNDGIGDILFLPPDLNGSFFGTALGRGDGSFAILNQTTPLPSGDLSYFLIPGDFNGDGKVDTLAIQDTGGNFTCAGATTGQLLSFLGSGDGRFAATGTPLSLGVIGALQGIAGDFNADGKLDVVVQYTAICGTGLIYVPGKGDGTFGPPVNLNATQGSQSPKLLLGDLNNDKKLDFIWGDAVFLGNGDGTFKQIPLTVPANNGVTGAIALADLNGDGILDAVSAPGITLYAGIGDGTFKTTAFYSAPGLAAAYTGPLSIGDVNGDGYPDLLVVQTPYPYVALVVYLGDGHGNYTQDTNVYALATSTVFSSVSNITVRLNNQAPALASDGKLDVLIQLVNNNAEDGVPFTESLLNQLNPTPSSPAPLTSSTTLQASPVAGDLNQPVMLTATVSGENPTGSVTFATSLTSLGSASLANGVATLQTSFAAAGSYNVTAAYAGDQNNAGSVSSAVAITIAAPDFTVAATPTSLTIPAGQTASFTFTVTPVAGYSGTLKFACGTLPSLAVCSFAPASVTPSSGASASSTLTVTTAAASAMLKRELPSSPSYPSTPANDPWLPVGALAMAGAVWLGLPAKKLAVRRCPLRRLRCVILLSSASLLLTLGCGGGGSGNHPPSNPGTPAGSYMVSVTISDSAGGPQHAVNITLTVQ